MIIIIITIIIIIITIGLLSEVRGYTSNWKSIFNAQRNDD